MSKIISTHVFTSEIDEPGLLQPDGLCYQGTAAYGLFGYHAYPGEKTDGYRYRS